MSVIMTELKHKKIFPLTGAQRNVWFHQKVDVNATAYRAGQHIVIEGDLDTQRLDRIQQQSILDTEILSLRFVEVDQEPYQTFYSLTAPPWPNGI